MFDIGFSELALISMVSLVILGPQRLPQTVRFVLNWIQRSKQFTKDLSSKLENELNLEELNQTSNQMFDGNSCSELRQVQQSLTIPKVRRRVTTRTEGKPELKQTQTSQQKETTL